MLRQNTLDDLVWDIAENAGRLLGFEDCVLYLCEPHGLVQVSAFGIKSPNRHKIKDPIVIVYGDGIVGTVAATGNAECIGDLRSDPRYIPDQFAGKSELAVPIAFEGNVLGVLDSECSRLHGFTATDEAMATSVAAIAAPRIASALAQQKQDSAEKTLVDVQKESERREDLLRVQRHESLGLLAGGIAHDFNNLLTAILGNICLAREDPTAPDTSELLEEAENACARARSLTQQLLTFARGGKPVKAATDLGPLLHESVTFALRGFNVAAEFDISKQLNQVVVDAGQMTQVFHNLALNAAQAMDGAGRIWVSARRVADDQGIEICVRDNGPGVPAEAAERIFEPYYTTKDMGSGLGLATSYWIVRQHGGHMELVANQDLGASFRIRLPLTLPLESRDRDTPSSVSHQSGRILVLEDEEAVQRAILKMVDRLGHEAIGVDDGEACISTFARALAAGRPFDVVLLDLTIPGGLGGAETIRRLRAIDASVKALVVSGYSDDPVLAEPERYGFRGRIQKPFDVGQLARELNRLLAP